jgi:hypothetical protein
VLAVEFLPPDEHVFGHADAATFVGFDDDPGGAGGDGGDAPPSRWGTAAAVTFVTALLAAGIVAAAPWSDDAATPTPTTVPTGSTRPTVPAATAPGSTAPGSTAPDPTVTGWLLDPPVAGQRLVSVVDPGEFLDPLPTGWGEVWATPDATRTSGRWISITLQDDRGARPFVPIAPGALAIDDAGRPGRALIASDGVAQVQVQRTDGATSRFVTVEGFGVGLPQLLELTGSLSIDRGFPGSTAARPVIGRTDLLDGLDRLDARPTSFDLVDSVLFGPSPGGGSSYLGPGPRDVTLLREYPIGTIDPRLTALAVTDGLGDTELWATFTGFSPVSWSVGERVLEQYDLRVVRFTTEESDVLLVTTLAAGALPAMLDDVRRVEATEWAAARDRARAAPGPTVLPDDGVRTVIGGGTLDDGTPWSIEVSTPDGDLHADAGGFRLEPWPLAALIGTGREGAIGTIAVAGTTVVVAASSVEGAVVRIRSADGTVTDASPVAVVAPDEPPTEPGRLDESFWTSWEGTSIVAVPVGAADPGTPFVAEIVGPDGTVLATLDPWLLGGAP